MLDHLKGFRMVLSRRSIVVLITAGMVLSTAAILGLNSCSSGERQCVLLIIMDTTRYDRFGCTGHRSASTPTLDSLATQGVRFANTVTATPVTGPAITTILSSVSPPVHGVRDNARFIMSKNLGLLAEAFKQAGYQTGGIAAAIPLLARFGYDRGFDYYDDRFSDDPYRVHNQLYASKEADLRTSERRASAVTDHALQWLAGVDKKQSVFMLVHYFDPHYPYDPPPAYAARFPNEPYDGEVAYMDAEIGRLLAGIRQTVGQHRVLAVAVADHGEGLSDHEEGSHGFFIYDSTVKVPLIFAGGGCSPGLVVDGAVRTLDVAPTICAWSGIEAPATFAGRDLTSALIGDPVPVGCDTAFVETFWPQLHYNWSPLQGLRTATWKWIKAPRPELYNIQSDPAETANLIDAYPDVVASLTRQLDAYLADAADRARRLGASESEADPQLDRQLAALGYVSGSRQRSIVPDFSLPDPKDGNRNWNREQARQMHLAMASVLHRSGKTAEALHELELAAEVRELGGKEAAMRGMLLHKTGRSVEAVRAYESALHTERDPLEAALSRLELIDILVATGQKRAAESHYDTLKSNPDTPPGVRAALAGLKDRIRALR
jgi:arylsulfatase A-like enzyme